MTQRERLAFAYGVPEGDTLEVAKILSTRLTKVERKELVEHTLLRFSEVDTTSFPGKPVLAGCLKN